MIINLILITIFNLALNIADGSVVGVTYMDDFDFEQRYLAQKLRNCDPFYWHPLHLPEECADMYEKLIRTRLPVRFPKQASPQNTYSYTSYSEYSSQDSQEAPELTPYEAMLESVQKDVNNFPSMPLVKQMPNLGPVAVYQQPISKISANMIKKVANTYIDSLDDKDGKKRRRKGKSGSKWKQLVKKVRRRERDGWKKINNGDIISFSKP